MSVNLTILRSTTKIIIAKYKFWVIDYSLLVSEVSVYENNISLYLTIPVKERKENNKNSWNIARQSLFGTKMDYIEEKKCVQTAEVSETYLVSRDWVKE